MKNIIKYVLVVVMSIIIYLFIANQNGHIVENKLEINNLKDNFNIESDVSMNIKNFTKTDNTESPDEGACILVDKKIMLRTDLFDSSGKNISKNEYRYEKDFNKKCKDGFWTTHGDLSNETAEYYLDCNEAEESKKNCDL